MKKGQFALEFVILVSFTILFTAVFLVLIQGSFARSESLKQEERVFQVMRIISTEVDLARSSPSGYTRTFYIPTSIDDIGYSVNSSDGIDVVFDYAGKTYVFFLSNGSLDDSAVSLKTGYNKIYKDCSLQNTICSVKLLPVN
ncbi:MAG: hypothetical protein WC758_06180 [Candidatus Woesearchaeota archaeon]|jgi:hypothetical protein